MVNPRLCELVIYEPKQNSRTINFLVDPGNTKNILYPVFNEDGTIDKNFNLFLEPRTGPTDSSNVQSDIAPLLDNYEEEDLDTSEAGLCISDEAKKLLANFDLNERNERRLNELQMQRLEQKRRQRKAQKLRKNKRKRTEMQRKSLKRFFSGSMQIDESIETFLSHIEMPEKNQFDSRMTRQKFFNMNNLGISNKGQLSKKKSRVVNQTAENLAIRGKYHNFSTANLNILSEKLLELSNKTPYEYGLKGLRPIKTENRYSEPKTRNCSKTKSSHSVEVSLERDINVIENWNPRSSAPAPDFIPLESDNPNKTSAADFIPLESSNPNKTSAPDIRLESRNPNKTSAPTPDFIPFGASTSTMNNCNSPRREKNINSSKNTFFGISRAAYMFNK